MFASNPFNRNKACPSCGSGGSCGCSSADSYVGKENIEGILSQARPHILVRTDSHFKCPCQDLNAGTGQLNCSRCFGLGKVVISLDVINTYLGEMTLDIQNNIQASGFDRAFNKVAFMGRWVYPTEGQLLLEVGWNTPITSVFSKQGKPVEIYNIYHIGNVNFTGFAEIMFVKAALGLSNDRIPYIKPMVLQNNVALHPWKYLSPFTVTDPKAAHKGKCSCW